MTVAPKGLVHCPPTAYTEQERTLLAYIDAQQAEIARLKAENAKLLSDVTRPESLDVGLMRAEIERLRKDADSLRLDAELWRRHDAEKTARYARFIAKLNDGETS